MLIGSVFRFLLKSDLLLDLTVQSLYDQPVLCFALRICAVGTGLKVPYSLLLPLLDPLIFLLEIFVGVDEHLDVPLDLVIF